MAHGETPADRHVLAGGAAETVAVLGAGGTMGFTMARNIARAGIPVRAWNRTRAKHGDEDVSATYLSSALSTRHERGRSLPPWSYHGDRCGRALCRVE